MKLSSRLPIASHYRTISNIISICEELAVDVMLPADFFKSRLVAAAIDDSRAWPAFTFEAERRLRAQFIVKRLIDIVGSLMALVVSKPTCSQQSSLAIKLIPAGPFCLFRNVSD